MSVQTYELGSRVMREMLSENEGVARFRILVIALRYYRMFE